MSQAAKNKAASPRVKNGTPDTSFAASPFAKGAGTPTSPFKATLSAFPPLPQVDEYAGFDDTWRPDSYEGQDNEAGPSTRMRGVSNASRRRTPSYASSHAPQRSLGGVDDLEAFFESGTLK